MAFRRPLARAGVLLGGSLWLLAAVAPPAGAHPLGNFSINRYTGFTVHPDRVEALAVTDTAEIPTLQQRTQVDRDGSGTVDDSERVAWAAQQCSQSAQRLTATAGSEPLHWAVASARFDYADGAAGLQTSRLECALHAPLRVSGAGTVLRVATGSDATRVGWNEITARGDGVRISQSDVPQDSISRELRDYPRDLLDSPSGVTRAQFTAVPGDGPQATPTSVGGSAADGPTAWLARLDAKLAGLGAAQRLTLPVGLLAVLLSVVLGAGHALLPGHGKTIMAAYLAGRRGSTRDALTVGATVTVTHTAGVLVLGLCLTAFSSLAGDVILGWLGVTSGALVTLVGAGLLLDAARRARAHPGTTAPGAPAQRTGSLDPVLAGVPAAQLGAHSHDHQDGRTRHDRPHPHPEAGHHHEHDHGHEHERQPGTATAPDHDPGHRHGLFGHHHHHGDPEQPMGKRGLIGLGIAGGLVPSPSALVVLLGAVALGRTLFGAGLVLAYGLGMAGTLTAAGLLFVRLGDTIAGVSDRPVMRVINRITPYTALLTALLVVTVGTGLIVRSLPSTL